MSHGGSRIGAGRPRLTADEKATRGTLRPGREKRYAERDAALPGGEKCPVPPPPEDLLDEVETDSWTKLAAQVDAVGTYAEEHEEAFRNLVTAHATMERWRRMHKALREQRSARQAAQLSREDEDGVGASLRDSGELEFYEPLTVGERLNCQRTIASLLARFGLDPLARAKVATAKAAEPPKPEADPDDFSPLPGRLQ